jgi:hypothetical protein
MLLNGKAFRGNSDYEDTDRQLRLCSATSTFSITRFRPFESPDAGVVYKLLLALYKYNLCCFLTGSYALFLAGTLDSYDGLALFVAVTDYKATPILAFLLKKNKERVQSTTVLLKM